MHKNSELQLSLLSNFNSVITVHLDDTNYVIWRFMMESMLVGCDLMGYIDGSIPCPPQCKTVEEGSITSELTQQFKDWRMNDSALVTLLAATLSSDALSFIVGSRTSKEVWFSLEQRYGKLSKYKAFELQTSMQKIQKGNDSIDKYMQRFKTVRDQLSVAGFSIPDEDIVAMILNGLPSEFATMKTIVRIKTLTSDVSLEELRSLLLIAEDEIDQSKKSISLSLETALAAFGDKSGARSISQINHVPAATMSANTEFVNSSVVPPIDINSTLHTPGHHQLVTQMGRFPYISQAAGCVKASTNCHSACNGNTMVDNGSLSPITVFGPQLSSNAHVLHPSTTPIQAFGSASSSSMPIHPHTNGFSSGHGSLFSWKNRSSIIVCHFCVKRGHYAYNCYRRTSRPLDSASSSYIKCQICYCFGHVALACPQRPAAGKIASSGASLQCQICLQIGHSVAECFHRHHYVFQLPTSAKSQCMTASSSQPTLCFSWPHGIGSQLMPPFSPG